MNELESRRDALLAELRSHPDPHARMDVLMQRARHAPALPDELRVEAHRVEGCLSGVWVVPAWRDQRCWFRCDAESLSVKAIAGVLCAFYDGATPPDILSVDPSFLKDVGITQHLSANRRNAVSRVWTVIRRFAESHLV